MNILNSKMLSIMLIMYFIITYQAKKIIKYIKL